MPSSILIKNATVVTMDPQIGTLENADVLVRDNRIEAIGTGLAGPADKTIDATGKIVIPGMVDTHIHMWQQPLRGIASELWTHDIYKNVVSRAREDFSPKDYETAVYACGVEMIDRGITGAVDFAHGLLTREHAESVFAAHHRTGQRVLMGYGLTLGYALDGQRYPERDLDEKFEHIAELSKTVVTGEDALVQLGVGLSEIEAVGMERFKREVEFARSLGLRSTLHQNAPHQLRDMRDEGLLGSDLIPVHVNAASDEELAMVAEADIAISVTPEVEVSVGRSLTVLNRAIKQGVKLCIGTDTPARVPLDLFSQLRISNTLMQAQDALQARDGGRLPLNPRENLATLKPGELLATTTVNPAYAFGLGDSLGTLAPGKLADLVVMNSGRFSPLVGDPAAYAVIFGTSADVETVLVNGVVRKEEGRLVGVDEEALMESLVELKSRVTG
ncbi:amidohydrolase family protein [Streptomyces sp. NPDC002454]|uniref:amidohydrolase family protein n=1 Tax=Streptomyces sp. NPDC002490 TaxID=3154416 RepID=UPI00332459A4